MGGDYLTILIGAPDPESRALYGAWLPDGHELREASDGRAVFDAIDPMVDVVILDRDLPGPSVSQLMNRIGTTGVDPHVAVLSAAPVDDELLETGVHEYLRKPIDRDDLLGVIAGYRARRDYESALSEYFSITSAVAAMEADHSPGELAQDERYERLQWLADEKRFEADRALRQAEPDWNRAFRALGPGAASDSPGRPV